MKNSSLYGSRFCSILATFSSWITFPSSNLRWKHCSNRTKPQARKRMHAFVSVDWKQHTPFYEITGRLPVTTRGWETTHSRFKSLDREEKACGWWWSRLWWTSHVTWVLLQTKIVPPNLWSIQDRPYRGAAREQYLRRKC